MKDLSIDKLPPPYNYSPKGMKFPQIKDGRYLPESVGAVTEMGRVRSVNDKGDLICEHGIFIAPARMPYSKFFCNRCSYLYAKVSGSMASMFTGSLCPNCSSFGNGEVEYLDMCTYEEFIEINKQPMPPRPVLLDKDGKEIEIKWARLGEEE